VDEPFDRDKPVADLRELQFILIRVRDSNRYEHDAMQKSIRDLEDTHTQAVRERVDTMNAVQKLNERLDKWEAADREKDAVDRAPLQWVKSAAEWIKVIGIIGVGLAMALQFLRAPDPKKMEKLADKIDQLDK
jgi:cysteinyl-tRNA synthetase